MASNVERCGSDTLKRLSMNILFLNGYFIAAVTACKKIPPSDNYRNRRENKFQSD